MELDAFECAMLDTVLETLAGLGSLTASQLLALFDGDEDHLLAMIDELVCEGLVSESGYAQGSRLPLLLNLERKGMMLLKNGGFTARYDNTTSRLTIYKKPQAKKLRLLYLALKARIGTVFAWLTVHQITQL